MKIEQERQDFEAWWEKEYNESVPSEFSPDGHYPDVRVELLFRCWKAGRAALQEQDREDAERLDWMEEQAQSSRSGVSMDYVYDVQDGYVIEKGFRFMRYHFIGKVGKTVREAIDHARRRIEEES